MRTRKSFTGCWTCRTRRLKCDETKPACLQCTVKGIDCEGYSSKLQWLRPMSTNDTQGRAKSSKKGVPRRRLLPASTLIPLNENEIETALTDLDKISDNVSSKSRGPFSVLRLESPVEQPEMSSHPFDHYEPLSKWVGRRHHALPLTEDNLIEDNDDLESNASRNSLFQSNGQTPVESPLIGGGATVHQNPVFDHIRSIAVQPASPELLHNAIDPLTIASDLSLPMPSGLSLEQRSTALFPPDTVPGAVFLDAEVKYLLRNYANNVVPIFSPLDLRRNPWRLHHLSCALQCSIELEILGASTQSKKALLHTILTISAYNLRNTVPSDHQGEGCMKWNRVASHYKGEALRLLETCVADSSSKLPNNVYNELLAAMLAMVTIDVISGETRTSEIHLEACETLIREQLTRGQQEIPNITKALHSIFLYLRIMQEATRVLCDRHKCKEREHQNLICSASSVDDCNTNEDILTLIASQSSKEEFDWWSSELMYGLPPSLLLLLRKVTKLLEMSSLPYVEAGESSKKWAEAAEQLEDEILEWPVEDAVAWLGTAPVCQGNRLVMQHYTQAFHQAVVIFFCGKCRKMHRKHLQQYVHKVILHLEQVEKAKKEYRLRAGSMLWPAFVAGSHAVEQDVQNRVLRWLDLLDREGIWTSRHTKDALMGIWSQEKPSPGIAYLNTIHIMLT